MLFIEDEVAEKIVAKSAVTINKTTLSALKKASYEDLAHLIHQTPSLLTLVNTANQELHDAPIDKAQIALVVKSLGRSVILKLAYFAIYN
ncbi:hypothetical protein [Thalassotalea sediminis]|uniref:hypothetical protein n=1 Tax=Thalassotalea sediminis TaxID=1759089 RepID=UPI0025744C41|nr:hypothetical protein [Thalassotalea sediminis]